MSSQAATKKRATRSAPAGHERMADMSARIGLSKSLLYKWMQPKHGRDFPQPIRLSRNLSVFNIAAVDQWLAEQGIVLPGQAAAA